MSDRKSISTAIAEAIDSFPVGDNRKSIVLLQAIYKAKILDGHSKIISSIRRKCPYIDTKNPVTIWDLVVCDLQEQKREIEAEKKAKEQEGESRRNREREILEHGDDLT